MKWIRNLLVVWLLMTSTAWAAGTIVVQSDKIVTGLTGKEVREISYLVTFGADGSSPVSTGLDSILKSNGLTAPTVGGWWLLEVSTLYGTVGPTDNTDMYLYRVTGTNKIDVLGGNGVNAIDNAANNTFNPATTTRPLIGDDILVFTNNVVFSATCTVVFTLYR